MTQRHLSEKRRLIGLLSVLLCLGFLATSFASYYASRASIRRSIVEYELPLTSDNIYSEIQKDLVRPIFVSSMMAGDTFLRDWVLAGEDDAERITKYLKAVQTRYGAMTCFFVSERSSVYYQSAGVLKKVSPDEPRDVWYYRVRGMEAPYEINVDPDMANRDALTIFINYRVFDYDDRFIGATGVGLTVDAVRTLIRHYQERYERSVYFVDKQGRVVLYGSDENANGSDIRQADGLGPLADAILAQPSGRYEFRRGGQGHLLNARFIPELNWYLFVEKTEDPALAGIRGTLYLNLFICLAITAFVLTITALTVNHYQSSLEAMATTDKLTGLANRRAFELLAQQALREAKRDGTPIAAAVVDIDLFKSVNDRFGHVAGDEVIRGVAEAIRAALRQSDIVCRWGGEEYLIFLKGCNLEQATRMAEKIRQTVAAHAVVYGGLRIQVTISLGVAVQRAGEDENALTARADRALYRAKEMGRNCVATDTADDPGVCLV